MPRAAIKKTADVMDAPSRETHSSDFQIGEHAPITDNTPREDVSRASFDRKAFGHRLKEHAGNIVKLDGIEVTPDYLAELAFYEEPVTILINPSTHKHAASIFENWSNGQGAEVLINGKWLIVKDLPVDKPITVKRKIVEQIIRARVTNIQTVYENAMVENPRNELSRQSTPVHSFSVLEDKNPRSQEWMRMAYGRPI
jgi:hypothetical protein